jgi:hypothetical protein
LSLFHGAMDNDNKVKRQRRLSVLLPLPPCMHAA